MLEALAFIIHFDFETDFEGSAAVPFGVGVEARVRSVEGRDALDIVAVQLALVGAARTDGQQSNRICGRCTLLR